MRDCDIQGLDALWLTEETTIYSAANEPRPDTLHFCGLEVYLGCTSEEILMSGQLSPFDARAQLHRIIEQLTDGEAMALGRLICSWVVEGTTKGRAQREGEEQL